MAQAKRTLVIAPTAVDGAALRSEIEKRSGQRPAEVRVVSPAVTDSKLKSAFGDVDEALGDASARLERMLVGLRGGRVEASGAIGDNDPMVAAEDALGTFPADEVLIVTHRERDAEWFEQDLFDRAGRRLAPPVIHVELTGGGNAGLAEVEQAGPGIAADRGADDALEISPNLPPFSKRDLLGIGVAIVGTIVLALLAASSGDTSGGAAAARILIATAFALLNLAHVVGLVFFNSQQYRGAGRALFGNLSLFGTPVAILVSLLL